MNPSAPQDIPARGAWRAPSAVLSDRSRRVVSAMPSVVPEDDEEDIRPASRGRKSSPPRTTFYSARSTWWRPRTNFGRILLGSGAFIVVALLTTAGIVTRRYLVHDIHFRIAGASSIDTTGQSEVKRAELLPVFGEDIGRNIFFVPLGERRKQLEAIPWVKQATVMRFLPDHLTVSIVERTPVAFVREGSQVELVDADGVILSMPPALMAQHHYSFPVLTGIDGKDSLAARQTRIAVYQRFLAELDQNQQHLTAQVSEIDLSDPEDLRATMPEQGSDILAHFGEDHFLERLQTYKAHVAGWRHLYPNLIGVDLRYSGEVPLEMASAVNAGQVESSTAKIAPLPAAARPATAQPTKAATKPAARLVPAKSTPEKTATARRAAEAKKKAAKIRATKAAQQKAAAHKTSAHSIPAAPRQAQ